MSADRDRSIGYLADRSDQSRGLGDVIANGRLAQAPWDLTPRISDRIYGRVGNMAKPNQNKVFIGKGEVFFLNGALIRAHDAFNMELMLSDTFLLPSQIVSESTSKSPLQKAYYYAQQMMIEPAQKDGWQKRLDGCLVDLSSDVQKKVWRAMQEGRLQKVLAIIRAELKNDPGFLN